ncbi:MAG: prepilin-type N-terminal cleavage/methylation domain-containing protein [Phycisphaerae bacterium]|jgi:prepilin-type N-terminal cleavage/methylation domain-containing protein
MNTELKKTGFSLTEILIAIGILSVGMIFIAGVFPVGIHLTTIATERTIAAVTADEAFAKVRIYAEGDLGITTDNVVLSGLSLNTLMDFNSPAVFLATAATAGNIDADEFAYPSDPGINVSDKQYSWFALCRLTEVYPANPNPPVQVTVFVCRRISPNLQYYQPTIGFAGEIDWTMPLNLGNRPVPIKIAVTPVLVAGHENELAIAYSDAREIAFINDGYTIVDDATGRIYRVLERYKDDPGTAGTREDSTILLDRDWQGGTNVWVVPPPVNGGLGPCIAVYQKIIRF